MGPANITLGNGRFCHYLDGMPSNWVALGSTFKLTLREIRYSGHAKSWFILRAIAKEEIDMKCSYLREINKRMRQEKSKSGEELKKIFLSSEI